MDFTFATPGAASTAWPSAGAGAGAGADETPTLSAGMPRPIFQEAAAAPAAWPPAQPAAPAPAAPASAPPSTVGDPAHVEEELLARFQEQLEGVM